MKNLKKDKEFHSAISKLADDLHKKINAQAHGMQLSKLTFKPLKEDPTCPSPELYQDPTTGKWIWRCGS